jgi:branched-chain amino acid transport system permease protein
MRIGSSIPDEGIPLRSTGQAEEGWRQWLALHAAPRRQTLGGEGLLVAVIAAVAFVVTERGTVFSLDVATQFGLFTILVASLQLMLGYSNQASLAQGALYGVGAYLSAYMEVHSHVPVGLVCVSSVAAGMLCGVVIAVPLARLREHFLVLATLAIQVMATTLFTNLFSVTGGSNGEAVPLAHVGSLGLLYVILGVDLAVLIVLRRLTSTRAGRRLLAVKADETMAASVGVNGRVVRAAAVVVAFGMASGAGFLFSESSGFVAPSDFSLTVSLSVLVAVVVGGSSITWGTLVGAGAYSILQAESTSFPGLSVLILGVFLVVVLGYFPKGLTGLARDGLRLVTGSGPSSHALLGIHATGPAKPGGAGEPIGVGGVVANEEPV